MAINATAWLTLLSLPYCCSSLSAASFYSISSFSLPIHRIHSVTSCSLRSYTIPPSFLYLSSFIPTSSLLRSHTIPPLFLHHVHFVPTPFLHHSSSIPVLVLLRSTSFLFRSYNIPPPFLPSFYSSMITIIPRFRCPTGRRTK